MKKQFNSCDLVETITFKGETVYGIVIAKYIITVYRKVNSW